MTTKPAAQGGPRTAIAHHTETQIFVREADLVHDLIGKVSFTEMMFFQMLGRRPSTGETAILDAVLVAIMEHGHTPSSIVSRLIYDSAPEALQSAVAAGLLGVAGTFVGTMEGCAKLLEEILAAPEGIEAGAQAIADRIRAARAPLPGFGHPFHRPDDPRSPRLLAVAEAQGVPGRHIAALRSLSSAVDRAWGRHLTINVTGAIAAVLGEIGMPQSIMRGIAVVSRAGGLVGHIYEEQRVPTARHIWDVVGEAVPYRKES